MNPIQPSLFYADSPTFNPDFPFKILFLNKIAANYEANSHNPKFSTLIFLWGETIWLLPDDGSMIHGWFSVRSMYVFFLSMGDFLCSSLFTAQCLSPNKNSHFGLLSFFVSNATGTEKKIFIVKNGLLMDVPFISLLFSILFLLFYVIYV
jgi:hypothetical protein